MTTEELLDQFEAGTLPAEGFHHAQHVQAAWGYLLLIAERRDADPDAGWEAFAARHQDLLGWQPSILERYYQPDTLASDRARRAFVMPDRLEPPPRGDIAHATRGGTQPERNVWRYGSPDASRSSACPSK